MLRILGGFLPQRAALPLLLYLRFPRFDVCSWWLWQSRQPYIVRYPPLLSWNPQKNHTVKLRFFRAVVGQGFPLAPAPCKVTVAALQQNLSAFFDAYPFPFRVRFLLFQGSGLLNLAPSAFSCFLWKRKCRYASFCPPPPASSLGQIWTAKAACGGVLIFKEGRKKSS